MSAAGHLAAGCRLAGALTRAGTPARSLKIQSTIAATSEPGAEEEKEKFSSALPLLPAMTEDTLDDYRNVYAVAVSLLIIFGGLVAPVLEVKLGIGGASYADVIEKLHLPGQLAQVDPIVASFTGGAIGVLTALYLVEVNNVEAQAKQRCFYCSGSGYLGCGSCAGSGRGSGGMRCAGCGGSGKVMCTSCLCTGRLMATEHDQRIDPFE